MLKELVVRFDRQDEQRKEAEKKVIQQQWEMNAKATPFVREQTSSTPAARPHPEYFTSLNIKI